MAFMHNAHVSLLFRTFIDVFTVSLYNRRYYRTIFLSPISFRLPCASASYPQNSLLSRSLQPVSCLAARLAVHTMYLSCLEQTLHRAHSHIMRRTQGNIIADAAILLPYHGTVQDLDPAFCNQTANCSGNPPSPTIVN